MKKHRILVYAFALMLCVGVIFFPMAAYAQTDDTTPPTVTVEINGDMLKVSAKDDSGVAAIYINGRRFSTLVNGTANVKIKDYAGDGKQIEVYATDTAGNRSQSVMVDNPYYKSTDPLPAPAQTPVRTTTPRPSAAPVPTAANISAPTTPEPTTPVEPESTYSLPEPQPPDTQPDAISQSAINVADNSQFSIQNSQFGASAPFTPDGGGTVVDNATQQEGKEFFTVTATDGSVYYLIIDRQRGTQNVYFLSAVTREDLLSLTENGAVTAPGLSQPEPQTPESPSPTQQPESTEQPTQNEGGGGMGTIIFILIAVAVVGAAAYYFKIVKPRKDAAQTDEYEEYEDDDNMDAEDTDDEYFFDETEENQPDEPETED